MIRQEDFIMTNDEQNLYYERMNKMNHFLELTTNRQAEANLIATKAFKDYDELVDSLNNHLSITDLVNQIIMKKLDFRCLDINVNEFNITNIYYNFLCKAIKNQCFRFTHLELLNDKCEKIIKNSFEQSGMISYLVYENIRQIFRELVSTCDRFNIHCIEKLNDYYFADMLDIYQKVLATYINDNEEDREFIKMINNCFEDYELIEKFFKGNNVEIDFKELVNVFHEIKIDCSAYYDVILKKFFVVNERSKMKGEDKDINSTKIDLNRSPSSCKLMINFIENFEMSEENRNILYANASVKGMNDDFISILTRMNLIKEYHWYCDKQIKLNAIGWCFEHNFKFSRCEN